MDGQLMHKPKQKSMRRLAGQAGIITGASRGIGAATARLFAREGAAAVLAARDEQALQSISKEIQADGGQALVAPTDVGDSIRRFQKSRRVLPICLWVDVLRDRGGFRILHD
jgi:NADP-dependent 3-hydroxy acid dehydrogenase YdfG